MYLSKKKTLRILAYCATSAIFFSGTASAEILNDEDSTSNSTVTVSNSNYGEHTTSDGHIVNTHSDNDDVSGKTLEASDVETSIPHVNAGESYGSSSSTDNNTVTVRNMKYISFLHGGYAPRSNGSASYNIVNVYNSNIYHIHGGHTGSGVANYNVVNFYSGSVEALTGAGYASSGETNYNTLNIFGGTFGGTTQGGYIIGDGNALENEVNISDGTISGNVLGGYVGGSGNASGNRINISGGKITGEILGGYVGSGTVANNSINISGNPDLSGATLYAGRSGNNTDLYGSGNTLNFFTKNITVQNIGGFDTLNFYLPSNTQNGDTILTLTNGATDLSRTTVNLNAFGGNLHTGDMITLLTNQNGITISDVQNDGTIAQGISLEYELTNLGLNADGTAYTATVGERIGSGLKEQTKALTSAVIDTASLMDSGTDRLMEWLPESFELTTGTGGTDLNSIPTTGFDPFAGIGGSVVKIKTGDGSELKSKNGGLNVGMARYLRNRHGAFVFGPVTDYGQDHYESTMEDGTKGSGNSKYFTAGIIARQMNYGGMYYEASARYGRIQTNFVSDNFLVHNVPTHAYYDSSAPCYAGHVRVGWRNNISNESILDAYGIYSLNHVSGMTADVSTGETYTFSGVNSGRMSLGARLTRTIKDTKRFYSGIVFVHEFAGETHGTYMGMDTKKSSLKGNYGIIELGWQTKPSKNSPILIDTSLVGVMGDHKGLTISAKFKKDF